MNIVITLPTKLINQIICGDKRWEVRKTFPKKLTVGEDGFFCLQKGTKNVICWCRVDEFRIAENIQDVINITEGTELGVNTEWLEQYAREKTLKLWEIGKVIMFENPIPLSRLYVDRAPQSFVYTPLSYGESF